MFLITYEITFLLYFLLLITYEIAYLLSFLPSYSTTDPSSVLSVTSSSFSLRFNGIKPNSCDSVQLRNVLRN